MTLHPDKTRLVRFERPRGGGPPPSQFDLLGFTLFWGRSRKGHWLVQYRTAKSRFRRGLARIKTWCRFNRHLSLREQQRALTRKLRGHYAYYGVTFNLDALIAFQFQVIRIWRKWLSRRSQRAYLSWVKFRALLERFPLPPARIVHSFQRTAANA